MRRPGDAIALGQPTRGFHVHEISQREPTSMFLGDDTASPETNLQVPSR
jgi:hypothetical protein